MLTVSSFVQLCFLVQACLGLPKATLDISPANRVGRVMFSPDGKMFAAETSVRGEDPGQERSPLMLWDAATRKRRATFAIKQGKNEFFDFAAFAPDSKTIVTTRGGQPIRLWDVAKSEVRDTLDPGKGAAVEVQIGDGKTLIIESGRVGAGVAVFTPDGETLIVNAGKGPNLQFWNLEKKKIVAEIEDVGAIVILLISADGKRLAASENPSGRITVYDVATRKSIRSWNAGAHNGRFMAFSPDGNLLAVPGDRRMSAAKIMDVDTGKETEFVPVDRQRRLGGSEGLLFSPDGKILAISAGPFAHLYDLANHRLYATFPAGKYVGKQMVMEKILSMAFSPDGKTLAVACDDLSMEDTTIKLFDVLRFGKD